MVASLCGLRELIRRDPAPYRNLVHYFTNILKQVRAGGPGAPELAAVVVHWLASRCRPALQACSFACSCPKLPCPSFPTHPRPCCHPTLQAAEGKLGRAYEYHRAPAPFVQLELLRLLASLGAGDKSASENMYAVIAEVKRRAEPLGNNIGACGSGGGGVGRQEMGVRSAGMDGESCCKAGAAWPRSPGCRVCLASSGCESATRTLHSSPPSCQATRWCTSV